MTNTNLIKVYYFVVVAIVFGIVAHTLSVSSQYVVYGQRISALNKEKQQLVDQKRALQDQMNQELSMASLSQTAAVQGYTTLHHTIKVTDTSVVASR